MKDKLTDKKKRSILNESSSTIIEPSFSKITIRKRGYDTSMGKSHTIEEVGSDEEMNQSDLQGNRIENEKSKKKKKRNKEKEFSEGSSENIKIDKDDDQHVDLSASRELNELNYSENDNFHKKKKKKKKKKKVLEKHDFDNSLDEHSMSERLTEESGTTGEVSPRKEFIQNTRIPETEIELNEFSVRKKKAKHKKLMESEENKLVLPTNNDKSETLQSGEDINEAVVYTDSPLYRKKKKKTQMLIDESHLNVSDADQFENSKIAENNVYESCFDLDSSKSSQSMIKTKKKKKEKKKHKYSSEEQNSNLEKSASMSDDLVKCSDTNLCFNEKTMETHASYDSELNKFSKKKKKTKDNSHQELNVSPVEKNSSEIKQELLKRFEAVSNTSYENNNSQEFSGCNESLVVLPKTNKKRRSLQPEGDKSEDNIDSPLLCKKKKKTQELIDESNSNISSCNDLNASKLAQAQSKIKKDEEKKHKLSNENLQHEISVSMDMDDGHNIKCSNNDISSHERIVETKTNSDISPSGFVPHSPSNKLEIFEKFEMIGESKKRHRHTNSPKKELSKNCFSLSYSGNNITVGKRNSEDIKPLVPHELVISKTNDQVLRKIEHESLKEGDHLKEINLSEENQRMASTPATSTKSKNSVQAIGTSKIKNINKKSRAKEKFKDGQKNKNIDAIKKQLLKEAFTSTKKSKMLAHKSKSNKLDKKTENNTETLKMNLLKEAFSDTEKSDSFIPTSSKSKLEIKGNVDSLRMQLLNEALGKKSKTEVLSQKSTSMKKDVEKNVQRQLPGKVKKVKNPTSKMKNKTSKPNDKVKKQKVKVNNDIDRFTDMMISRALEKLSSCSASQSSQEDVNMHNKKKKDVTLKKHVSPKLNKKLVGLKNKFDLLETKKVEEKSGHENEIGKIQKSLLNDAMKTLCEVSEPSKKKKGKKKALETSEKLTSIEFSVTKKEKKKHTKHADIT